MFNLYKYVEKFNSNISTLDERDKAKKAFNLDLEENKIDKKLIKYLNSFFEKDFLVPIFSCEGHKKGERGYILFRSLYGIEETLSILKHIILFYPQNTDLNIHYWNYDSIGYCLYFDSEDLDEILHHLLEIIEDRRD